ncbi:hypothetical protein DFH07DRAFT_865407 [Mycena maculata]|uniref:Short-chain dehydrogenase/reductase family protein n=1 Tax=Mycena maculata TaxID=230809 RepID=A0AAD7K551_9AGAR|nr:hypothetical protein DFH07DRAFT_865407 [Mycena maculata]
MGLFQAAIPPLPETLSFAGKCVLVTGANSGLGLAACFHLVQRHVSTLVLAVRNNKVGEATKTALLADPIVRGLPTKPIIRIYELDLARPSSVEAFTSRILTEMDWVGTMAWATTPETNTEQMFQINYLSNAILCVRLLPLLRHSSETSGSTSHLTIVGSRSQAQHTFTSHPIPDTTPVFAFLNDPAHYRIKRYPDSKLLVSMLVRELAKRLDAAVVTVNNVCPGMTNMNIDSREAWWLRQIVRLLQAIRGRSPEVGARTLVYATAAGAKTHGELLLDYDVWEVRKWRKRLWEETLAAAETVAAGSMKAAGLED